MATTWLTYAWEDNKEGDVDFVAQELEQAGVSVKLDRWNLKAGKRLWEQIEHFIQDPQESDAWVLYATANSLGSEACKEEFAYALDRALRSRGQDFPVVGLFPGTVDEDLIPAGIRTRLYVSLTDPDWKERIKAAAPFYGGNPSPIDKVANLRGPVSASYAEHDGWITAAVREELKQALSQAGIQHEIKIYPGTEHAFFNDTRAEVHNRDASEDAWRRMLTLFRENL